MQECEYENQMKWEKKCEYDYEIECVNDFKLLYYFLSKFLLVYAIFVSVIVRIN